MEENETNDSEEPPQKFWCLSRDFSARNQFDLCELEATNEEAAWDEIGDAIQHSDSQHWILTKEEIETLQRILEAV
jgi:hypothetical protein